MYILYYYLNLMQLIKQLQTPNNKSALTTVSRKQTPAETSCRHRRLPSTIFTYVGLVPGSHEVHAILNIHSPYLYESLVHYM